MDIRCPRPIPSGIELPGSGCRADHCEQRAGGAVARSNPLQIADTQNEGSWLVRLMTNANTPSIGAAKSRNVEVADRPEIIFSYKMQQAVSLILNFTSVLHS